MTSVGNVPLFLIIFLSYSLFLCCLGHMGIRYDEIHKQRAAEMFLCSVCLMQFCFEYILFPTPPHTHPPHTLMLIAEEWNNLELWASPQHLSELLKLELWHCSGKGGPSAYEHPTFRKGLCRARRRTWCFRTCPDRGGGSLTSQVRSLDGPLT